MSELIGKTALVTGGSRGIGAAIVRRLGQAGAHVAVNYAGSKDAADALVAEIVAAGGRAFAVQADVSSLAGIEAMFAACDAEFGGAPNLDILINNAGVGRGGRDGSLKGADEALFDELFAVNVKGPHFVTQAALPRLRDGGRIVNIGSMSGKVGQPFAASYAMTKRAIQSLTFSTALAVAKRRITCNCVAPGAVATDFIAALREQPGWDEATAKHTPMGRVGEPGDIAGAVMMLLGDDARWVTGQVIEASGGLAL
ncbi:SDR family oxidoreductase [Sphingopyxis sp. YF1]|uniref:SDR family NAD(P)-dependent oxidoreductase n=1 Tax=Sphingopyxis sp. YF1 TaxID=2482763 RepID=UPI001F622D9D|nr:SDR family oxidoreductase [Sphingopyxis sp. YF1]UNU42892.1 SDR family oxidoreductase [Sphingopyxis sp. YF1]